MTNNFLNSKRKLVIRSAMLSGVPKLPNNSGQLVLGQLADGANDRLGNWRTI